jgi:hypothetical protein
MSKNLYACQVQDGWLVNITESITVKTESDVKILIRQNGLKITERLRHLKNFEDSKIIRAE